MRLEVGQAYIDGHSPETARQILAAAKAVNVPPLEVRTTDSGFVVPGEVADELDRRSVPTWAGESAVF